MSIAISAIVPVHDGAATLARCLAPLARMKQAGEIAELIVADDGCTDDSAAIAAAHGARVVESGGRLGPGGARNAAAAVARGDVLWFVDADVVVHPDAAGELAQAFARTGADAVFGSYDDAPPAQNFLSQYKNLVHHFHHSEAEGEAETFWAGCGAIRRDAFVDAGGFDAARYPRPSIEDIELGARLRERGCRIWLAPQVRATHLKVWRLAGLLRTEIFARALPWSRLIHAHPARAGTLNLRPAERARALLALALAASVVLALARVVPAWVPIAMAGVALVANRRLFALFRRRRGSAFALAGVLFHQLYYLYASAAFAWSAVERLAGAARSDGGGRSSSAT